MLHVSQLIFNVHFLCLILYCRIVLVKHSHLLLQHPSTTPNCKSPTSLVGSGKELLAQVGRLYDVCQLASDQLLLTGGSKRCGVKVDCWLLNLVNMTWTYMLPLSIACHNHRSIMTDQYVCTWQEMCQYEGDGICRMFRHRTASEVVVGVMPFDHQLPQEYTYSVAKNMNLSCTQAYDTLKP